VANPPQHSTLDVRRSRRIVSETRPFLKRILHWTNGHPYLTQMLCAKVAEQNRDLEADSAVDAIVQDKLLSTAARQEENNLKFVADRLTQGTRDLLRVLRVYRDVLREKPVKDLPASLIHTSLRLSGAVKPDTERRLQVRNRVYRQVFDEKWVREKMPSDVAWMVGASSAVAVIAILSVWYWLLFPRPYIQVLETASSDSQVAYTAYDALQKPFHRAQADDLLAQIEADIATRRSRSYRGLQPGREAGGDGVQ
jgi:hypothetical protein